MADTHVSKFLMVPAEALDRLAQSGAHQKRVEAQHKDLFASVEHKPHVPAAVAAARAADELAEFLANKELTDRPIKLGIHDDGEDPAVRAVQNAELAQSIAAALNQIQQQQRQQQQRRQPATPDLALHVRRLFDQTPTAEPGMSS